MNRMWRFVKNRPMLSREGRAWKEMAALELMTQRGGFKGPCYWRVSIQIPGTCKADIDNFCKGILDAMAAAEKSPDDRYLVDLRIRFYDGEKVIITLRKEDLQTWATIKRASKSLLTKLSKG